MKQFLLTAIIAAMTVSLNVQCATSHASENYNGLELSSRETSERNLKIKKSFSKVVVKTGVRLFYTVGSANTVRIFGQEDQVEHTVVTVEDGTLQIYLKRDELSKKPAETNVAVYVNAPAFSYAAMNSGAIFTLDSEMSVSGSFSVQSSSGSIFKSDKGLKCGSLFISPSSGSIVDISGISAGVAKVSSSSGAIVTLKGTATKLDAHISSGSIANLTDLKAKEGSVHASSGAIVNVSKGMIDTHSSSGAIVNKK
ncbi:MAG: DUF2807 domain-containing protein [Duncaniella sp.]|nr:DUF2807 domain-containing protein [Duncaniella sp.]